MYRLRPFRASDWESVRKLHEQRGFDFAIPKSLAEAAVIEDEETGQVVQIVATRETREVYLWLDPDWATPRWRWDAFTQAHEVLRLQLLQKGVEDVHVWLEPSIEKGFGRKLMRKLGWVKHLWQSYSLKLRN